MKIKLTRFILTAVLSLTVVLLTNTISAQEVHPISWTTEVKQIDDNTAEIIFKAKIHQGWNLYALDVPPGGPLPTEFTFSKNQAYKLAGKMTTQPKAKVSYDDVFEMEIGKWDKQVNFMQKITVLKQEKFTIPVEIAFMMCDDNSCIPLFDELKITIDGSTYEITTDDTLVEDTEQPDTLATDTTEAELTVADDTNKTGENKSVWVIFWIGLLGGLLALVTPCVWPVIPMTVSFFLNRTQKKGRAVRDALFYGISVIIIYVTLGLTISAIFGPTALGELASNPGFNVFFFVLLVIFAIAFFGAFELTLPSKWVNAIDQQTEKKGGLMGVFFMALTLVLVSFSCTGPILGTILVQASTANNFLAPLMGMFGFSVAIAIPFSLLVIFPSWLKSMPKSGGWMNSVKVVLAFLMLAFSLRFLAVADGVAGWGILPRELAVAIWFVIFLLMGFYLLGKIKMSHDSDVKHIGVFRLFLAMTSFVAATLLLPGLWGAPMKAVSGFMPPLSTQTFNLNKTSYGGAAPDLSIYDGYNVKEADWGYMKFLNYDEGMEFAKKHNKPVLLDFTGESCSNCKTMEASVFGEDKVLPLLRDKFVVIALYTDDRTPMPEDQHYENAAGRNIKSYGQKWGDFQTSTYKVNALPYYVLLDNEGKKLVEPTAYNTNVEAFANFLKSGLDEYEKRQ